MFRTDSMPDGRVNNGGARPGAGRKSDALRAELRRLIDEAISPQDWKEILAMVSRFARSGNLNACEFLLDRKFGKPTQTVEDISDAEPETPYEVSRLDPEE